MAFFRRPSSITMVRLLFSSQETHDVTVETQVHLPQPRRRLRTEAPDDGPVGPLIELPTLSGLSARPGDCGWSWAAVTFFA